MATEQVDYAAGWLVFDAIAAVLIAEDLAGAVTFVWLAALENVLRLSETGACWIGYGSISSCLVIVSFAARRLMGVGCRLM